MSARSWAIDAAVQQSITLLTDHRTPTHPSCERFYADRQKRDHKPLPRRPRRHLSEAATPPSPKVQDDAFEEAQVIRHSMAGPPTQSTAPARHLNSSAAAVPQTLGFRNGIDLLLAPPRLLIARIMQGAVMQTAERDSELGRR